jgi:hypothetical protein
LHVSARMRVGWWVSFCVGAAHERPLQ